MGINVWLSLFLGVSLLWLAAAVSSFIPNWIPEKTVPENEDEAEPLLAETVVPLDANRTHIEVLPRSRKWRATIQATSRRMKEGANAAISDKQLLMLLALIIICQLSQDPLPMVLLLYVSKRFGWTFARVSSKQVCSPFLILLTCMNRRTFFGSSVNPSRLDSSASRYHGSALY